MYTVRSFQSKYHGFMTLDKAKAEREAESVNLEGIEDGEIAIAVKFGSMWCLMLKSAVDYIEKIDPDTVEEIAAADPLGPAEGLPADGDGPKAPFIYDGPGSPDVLEQGPDPRASYMVYPPDDLYFLDRWRDPNIVEVDIPLPVSGSFACIEAIGDQSLKITDADIRRIAFDKAMQNLPREMTTEDGSRITILNVHKATMEELVAAERRILDACATCQYLGTCGDADKRPQICPDPEAAADEQE